MRSLAKMPMRLLKSHFWWYMKVQEVVIVKSNGYIVTNYHVIDGVATIVVGDFIVAKTISASIGYDEQTDRVAVPVMLLS